MRVLPLIFLCFGGVAQAESLPVEVPLDEGAGTQVQVCNETPYSYELAFAFEQKGEIISLGWYDLSAGACSEDLAAAAAFEGYDLGGSSTLWLHARDARVDPDEVYGGEMELCVDDFFDVFAVSFADSTCAKRGYVRAGFQAVPFIGAGTYTLAAEGFL